MPMSGWKKLSQRIEKFGYRNIIFKRYLLPNGAEWEYTTYGSNGDMMVAIVALTPDNKVVIARQFRPGPERYLDELPGGDVDDGEQREVAVLRELREETGYVPERIEYLGAACRDAYSNVTAHYFIGFDCKLAGEQQLDEQEDIDVQLISIEQLLQNARSAKLSDVGAIFLAYDHLQDML
jgi:ADP-ribose pyrophosphatase